MSTSEELRVDDGGQVIGISHHDGRISALRFGVEKKLELLIIGADGDEAEILLLGVEYLILNNLREGNIIDRMYCWPLNKVPPLIMKRILKALSIASEDFLIRKFEDNICFFHLECSYGAELFALVHSAKVVIDPPRKAILPRQ